MNLRLLKYGPGFLAIIVLFAFSSAFAQGGGAKFAIQKGEILTYEAKFNRTLLPPLTVGDITFNVLEVPNGEKNYFVIKGEAKSRGIIKFVGKDFVQRMESTIDGKEFRALRNVKYDEQDERIRNSESVFDYKAGKVTFTETNPKEPARRPYQLASSIPELTHDIVSGVYALRMLPLAVGKSFELTVSDSGLVYKVPLRVTARVQHKTAIGRVWTLQIEPEVFGDNRPIRGNGKMIIWMTDDARRIPVRATISASIGKIEIKIKKNPVTAKPAA